MFSQEEISKIIDNCFTISEIIDTVKRIKELNKLYNQPLYNVQEISLIRLKQVTM